MQMRTWNLSEKKVKKSAEFTPRRLNGVLICMSLLKKKLDLKTKRDHDRHQNNQKLQP